MGHQCVQFVPRIDQIIVEHWVRVLQPVGADGAGDGGQDTVVFVKHVLVVAGVALVVVVESGLLVCEREREREGREREREEEREREVRESERERERERERDEER